MNDDGAKELLVAIVRQAVADYEQSLYQYNIQRNHEKKLRAKNTVMECELFFTKNISAYSDLDGKRIMKAIQGKVGNRLLKIGKYMEVPTNDNRRII